VCFYSAHEAAGASSARHSLRPLISQGQDFKAKLARMRGEIAKLCLRIEQRHCEEQSDEAIHSFRWQTSWIASRSLSSGAHSRPVGSQ
jgi:hypothetical protein